MTARTHPRRDVAFAALAAALALLLTGPPLALGDGCFISPFGRDIWEPAQKALILYDDETGREDLIIHASFYGDTKDFAWIIPTPSLPELEAADGELFFDCSRLTQPVTRKRTSGLGCLDGRDFVNEVPVPGQDEITIYDERTVGIYQTLTIGADNSEALTDSLAAWGFLHEQNERAIAEALQFYIDKSWYFVAMKTDTSSIWERRTPEPYWYGGIDPIRLSFASPDIIYPMRISAISADRASEILLYVCSAHRVSFTGASTEYANQITRYELLGIRANYPALAPYLTRPCFMTKLRKTFLAAEMGDDVTFQRAPNDHEYREIRYIGLAGGDAALLALVCLFIGRRWRRRQRGAGSGDPAARAGARLP